MFGQQQAIDLEIPQRLRRSTIFRPGLVSTCRQIFVFVFNASYSFVFLFLFVAFASRQLLGQTESKSQVFDWVLIGNESRIEMIALDLKDVSAGQEKQATLFFENRSEEAIELKNVKVGCKCTQAKVPQTTVAPGKTVQMDFQFSVPRSPLTLRENYDVTVETEGARESLRIRFTAVLENAVAFGKTEFFHAFGKKMAVVSFDIPLLASDKELLKDLKVHTSDSLSFLKISVSSNESKLQCKGFARELKEDETLGEIRLLRDDKLVASILCTLKRKPEIELSPQPIVLFPVPDDASGKREGHAFLRLRDSQANVHRTIRSVEVISQSETSVANLTKITDELYRVKFFVSHPQDFDTKEGVSVKISTSDGESYHLSPRCTFSNY